MPSEADEYERPATAGELIRFHDRHRLLLLAHDADALQALDGLVSRLGEREFSTMREQYWQRFRAAVASSAMPSGHVNALLAAATRLRDSLDESDWQGLTRAIEKYAAGAASLAAPVRLIRRFAHRSGHAWLVDQVYLQQEQLTSPR